MMRRLLPLELVWLLLLAPFVLLPGRWLPMNLHWVVVLALFVFWPLRLLTTGHISLPTPINLALSVLLVWLPVTMWASVDRLHSWEVAGYLLFGVVLTAALINHASMPDHAPWIAWALLALGAGLALLGPLLLTESNLASAFFTPVASGVGPIVVRLGETINPNILANALLVIAPVAISLALRWDWASHRWQPLVIGLLALWMAFIIVLTESRGSELAIALVLPLLLMLRWPRLIYFLPLLLMAAGAGLYAAGPDLLDQLASSSAVGGLDERIEIWQRALYAIQDFSFTGVGLGAYNQVIPLLYPYFLIPPSVDIPDAHNILLQVGVDMGVPGLIAYLAILVGVFVMLIKLLRRRSDALTWTLSAGLLGSFVAMLVGGVFAAVNWGVKLAFVNWLLIALTILLHRKAYEKTP